MKVYESTNRRVSLHAIPRHEHEGQDQFDTRLDKNARQYVVKLDDKIVGTLVKLYQEGMVMGRGCVGGSFPGRWEWCFFRSDGMSTVSSSRIKEAANALEWELLKA